MKQLTNDQVAAYHRDGYVIVPQFFSVNEVSKLFRIATEDVAISKNSYDLNDQTGKKTRLALWFTPAMMYMAC
jgi:ectoine hydroxylase-related dioxygenase (phytanoyl-CoA dioxygenase family)